MTIAIEQIDIWRGITSETQNLEFKEAGNHYDTRKLCRYCVAIANEGGGHLVLGIADKLPRAEVGNQAFPDTQDIAEKLFHWVGFRVDVEAVAHPDGRVVVFSIPARPKGTAYHHDGAYLMRSGEELVPMSEDQLRKQMTNQSLRERFGLSEGSSNTISQIITATMEQGLVKSDPNAPDSRRYARYIPAWA